MKIRHVALALSLLAPLPALAGQCPADMAKIDSMLAEKKDLPADVQAKVKALRAEGEALHKSGKHGESVKVLGEALDMLGAK